MANEEGTTLEYRLKGFSSFYSFSSDDDFAAPLLSEKNGLIDDESQCPCLPEPPEFNLKPPPYILKYLIEQSNLAENFLDDKFSCEIEKSSSQTDYKWSTETLLDNAGTSTAVEDLSIYYGVVALIVAILAAIILTLCFLYFHKFRWYIRRRKSRRSKTFPKNTATIETDQNSLPYSDCTVRKTDWIDDKISTVCTSDKVNEDASSAGFVIIRPIQNFPDFCNNVKNQESERRVGADAKFRRPLPNPPPYGTFKPNLSPSLVGFGTRSLRLHENHNLTYEEISLDRFKTARPRNHRLLETSTNFANNGEISHKVYNCLKTCPSCSKNNFATYSARCFKATRLTRQQSPNCIRMNGCIHVQDKGNYEPYPMFANHNCNQEAWSQLPSSTVNVPVGAGQNANPRSSMDSVCSCCCPMAASGSGSASIESAHQESLSTAGTCRSQDASGHGHVYDRVGQEYGSVSLEQKCLTSDANHCCLYKQRADSINGRESGHCTGSCLVQARASETCGCNSAALQSAKIECWSDQQNCCSQLRTAEHYHVIDPRFAMSSACQDQLIQQAYSNQSVIYNKALL